MTPQVHFLSFLSQATDPEGVFPGQKLLLASDAVSATKQKQKYTFSM